jgi:CheY-like chemotaxis protein
MPSLQEHANKGHVLAVDDCPLTRELMRASLEFYGYRVLAVDSGWAALDAVEQNVFDAIVLDVEMPGFDGMAVGRALRGNPRLASALIAMHSSMAEDLVRTGFSHYDAFVLKSDSPRALGERIDGLLKGRCA